MTTQGGVSFESAQKIIFVSIAIGSIFGSAVDSVLFWYQQSKGQVNSDQARVSDYTFIIYGLSLMISLGFLMVAIYRISSLLKKFANIELNSKHIGLHAVFLSINVALNITLSTLFIPALKLSQASKIISLFYFCCQPLSLLLMLAVITSMSQSSSDF